MKTVFSNSMCAHMWAQQTQAFGRSDNLSFNGPTLYSYRTAIGYIPDGAKFGLVALLTSNTYSATTSCKHMPAASAAVRGRRVWRVPQLGISALQCRDNLDYLQREYTKEIDALMRVSGDSFRVSDLRDSDGDAAIMAHGPTFAHRTLYEMAESIRDFMRTFDVAGPVLTPNESAAITIARRDRLLNDPKRQAKAAARVAQRAAADAKQRAADYARNLEYIDKWRAGEIVHVHLADEQGGALLRIARRDSGDLVQTSMGAEVPIAHARGVYRHWEICVREGLDITRDTALPEQFRKLGNFQLDSLDAKTGAIVAGCHTIHRAEIERLAIAAGWRS